MSLDEFMDDAEANVESSSESSAESNAELIAGGEKTYQYFIEEINHAVQEDLVSIRAQWTFVPRPKFDELSSTEFLFIFNVLKLRIGNSFGDQSFYEMGKLSMNPWTQTYLMYLNLLRALWTSIK